MQRELTQSKEFQNEEERLFIVDNIKDFDQSILSIDSDRTGIKTVKKIMKCIIINLICFLQMEGIKIMIVFPKKTFVNF